MRSKEIRNLVFNPPDLKAHHLEFFGEVLIYKCFQKEEDNYKVVTQEAC